MSDFLNQFKDHLMNEIDQNTLSEAKTRPLNYAPQMQQPVQQQPPQNVPPPTNYQQYVQAIPPPQHFYPNVPQQVPSLAELHDLKGEVHKLKGEVTSLNKQLNKYVNIIERAISKNAKEINIKVKLENSETDNTINSQDESSDKE